MEESVRKVSRKRKKKIIAESGNGRFEELLRKVGATSSVELHKDARAKKCEWGLEEDG